MDGHLSRLAQKGRRETSVAHPNDGTPPQDDDEVIDVDDNRESTLLDGQQVSSGEVRLREMEANTESELSYNVYDRDTLYEEVWQSPVSEVAKKYGVSDVTIHKVCRALDVPTPTVGYWAKLRAGKRAIKVPLPPSAKPVQRLGIRTGVKSANDGQIPGFLNDVERAAVLAAAGHVKMREDGVRLHPKIVAHRRLLTEWHKDRQWDAKGHRAENFKRWFDRDAPFLAETVSRGTLPRVFRILDALIRTMEPLGCSLTDDLRFLVHGESVPLLVVEAQDQIPHINTKEEDRQLLAYETRGKSYLYPSKPNIRKYDYIYNGRLNITARKSFRDCASYVLEDKLGEILIQVYEAANALRIDREAREAGERRLKEKQRLDEERRLRYGEEFERTLALKELAEDYDTACKIRRYVAAVEASGSPSEDTSAWLGWAKAKADWYDPTVAKEDDVLGKRAHRRTRHLL